MKKIKSKEEFLALPDGTYVLFRGQCSHGYKPMLKIYRIVAACHAYVELHSEHRMFPTNYYLFEVMDGMDACRYMFSTEKFDPRNPLSCDKMGIGNSKNNVMWQLSDDEALRRIVTSDV